MATFYSNDEIDISIEAAYKLKEAARVMRKRASFFVAKCDEGSLNINDVLGWLVDLGKVYKPQWATLVTTPNVTVVLQDEFGLQNVATILDGVTTAIQSMIDFLEANIPVNNTTNNYTQTIVLAKDGNGTVTGRQITNAPSLASFRTQLDVFRAALSS